MVTKITNPLLSQEYVIQEDSAYYWRVREGNGLIRIEYHELQEGVYDIVDKFCVGQHLLPALIEALQQFVD